MPKFDDDLLITSDDIGSDHHEDEVDRAIADLGIIEAYNRWSGKGTVEHRGGRTEGIKVRCPRPDHLDRDPSAWLNTEDDLWYCGACAVGGDALVLAAYNFGYGDNYQSDFPELKKRVAAELGFVQKRTIGGKRYYERMGEAEPAPEPVEEEPQSEVEPSTSAIEKLRGKLGVVPEVEPITEEAPPEDNIISLVAREDDPDFELNIEKLDWRGIISTGTFMDEWMQATCKDDLPEEYYFWLGMMSVGLAIGNQAALGDNPPVKPNLFICLYGPTGIGKSRATNATLSLLRRSLPWEADDPGGVYHIPSPGSAEALIDAFAKHESEDEDGEEVKKLVPVKGIIRFDELSTLMGRAERSGSAMKPTLMEFYDSYNPVTHKTRGHGEVTAENHFASAITTTQPRAIRELLTQTDADSGFVNRWIFAHGARKPPVAFGREELRLDAAIRELQALFEWGKSLAHSPARKVNEYGMYWTPIGMSREALELWSQFFHDVVTKTKENDQGNLLSRTDLAMKKIITLVAMNNQHTEIQLEDVENAIAMWDYLERSYKLLSQEIGVGVFEDCRLEVIKFIKGFKSRTKLDPKALDILRGMNSRFSSSLLRSVLETMVDFGELEEYQEIGKRGQPTKPRYAYREAPSK